MADSLDTVQLGAADFYTTFNADPTGRRTSDAAWQAATAMAAILGGLKLSILTGTPRFANALAWGSAVNMVVEVGGGVTFGGHGLPANSGSNYTQTLPISGTALSGSNPQPIGLVAVPGTSGQGSDAGHIHTPGASLPVLISTQTVTGSPAATVEFSSIPGTYTHLQLIWQAKGTGSGGIGAISLQFNGDTGSHYALQFYNQTNATLAGEPITTSSQLEVGAVPDGANASCPGAGIIFLPNYVGASFYQQVLADNAALQSGANTDIQTNHFAGWWTGTPAAITDILITPSAPTLAVGSVFSLYGLP